MKVIKNPFRRYNPSTWQLEYYVAQGGSYGTPKKPCRIRAGFGKQSKIRFLGFRVCLKSKILLK